MDAKILIAVILFVIFAIKTRLMAKLVKFLLSTNYNKKRFAQSESDFVTLDNANPTDSPLYEIKKAFYGQIEKTLEEIPGDVLEIGGGSGPTLHYLHFPKDSSLVVVDYNPHFEKHFRETLAKYPDVKLKDFLVQSAADMSNIPDNSFSVVLVSDVLCSIDEEVLVKIYQEIKRVLKPNGCFYFLEHVADKPGTWRRFFQRLVCWTYLWPCLFDNCHCDREPWRLIQEADFSSVNLSFQHIPWLRKPEIYSLFDKFMHYHIQPMLSGHAKK